MNIDAMSGLNVYAEVFVPMSAGHNQVATEAKDVEEVGAQGTIAEVNSRASFGKQTSKFTDTVCIIASHNWRG